MKWPFGKKALTGTGDAVMALRDPGYNIFPLLGGGSRERIQNVFNRAQSANYGWLYANSPAVRTVIDVIVRNVGELELRLFEEIGEAERQPRADHAAALSMRYPNETTTADGLIRSLFKDFLIYDNAYALLMPGANNTVQLVRIPAYMVEVMGRSLFQAEVYRVWPQGAWTTTGMWGGAGTPTDYMPEQILHWHGEHPLDPRVGLSHLDTLRDVVAEDAAFQQAAVELANSGMTEPVYGYRPLDAPVMQADTIARMEEDLGNKVKRSSRRPFILQEGTELKGFGVSPQDAQMMEVRRWAVERIATAYGVPLAVVGMGSGRAENLADAQAQLYTDTLLPYCQDFSKMLDQRLLVRVYNWTDGTFEFSFDEKLMGNDRLRAFTTATGRPVMLTNEARAKLNLPPVDGGDDLVTPDNVTAGDKPLPSVGVMPIQDPNGPAQDGSHREEPKALTKAEEYTPLPQLHPGRKAELDRQQRAIDMMQGVVQRHYNRLGRSLKAKADGNWPHWDNVFAAEIRTALSNIVESEGSRYAMKFGGYDFDMGLVRNYLIATAEGAAQAINDKIKAEIADMGVDGALSQGGSHVVSAGTSLGAAATMFARKEAAKQTPGGEQRVKTWIADTDRHAEYDGDTVGIDEDWPAGFAPGGAPNCACTYAIS